MIFNPFRWVLALTLACTFWTVPVRAQSVTAIAASDAKRHFERGLELYEEDDFQAARIELKRAYNIAPTYAVLYDIGQVSFQLKDYAGALDSFESYLAQGGERIDPKRRERVKADVVKLRGRVGAIDVATASGAMVSIDGAEVGLAPLTRPIRVNIGRRTVRATLSAGESSEIVVDVSSSDETHVNLPIEPAPPIAAAPAAAPFPRADGFQGGPLSRRTSSSMKAAWALWVVTGIAATGAAVTGALALGEFNAADRVRTSGGAFADYANAESRMRVLSLTTDALVGAAILTGVVATYFSLKGPSSPSSLSWWASPWGAGCMGVF